MTSESVFAVGLSNNWHHYILTYWALKIVAHYSKTKQNETKRKQPNQSKTKPLYTTRVQSTEHVKCPNALWTTIYYGVDYDVSIITAST